ncbi:MAG: hypothetical protein PHO62_09485 [Sulfurimonas sp.]|nr:hypothetical protein [Sulfurimonas sp.]MDD5373639.1 hypothetical protein [Sulfurimonas sp.]
MTRFVNFRHPELDSGSLVCKKSIQKGRKEQHLCIALLVIELSE